MGLRLVHSLGDEKYTCIECGYQTPTREDLESHWKQEKHSPQDVQNQRLVQSRANLGWLLPGTDEDDDET